MSGEICTWKLVGAELSYRQLTPCALLIIDNDVVTVLLIFIDC
jgi:hypothetical protein